MSAGIGNLLRLESEWSGEISRARSERASSATFNMLCAELDKASAF